MTFRAWKYKFIYWFSGIPDKFDRTCSVENQLLKHYKNKTSPTPQECKDLAMKLGVPTWWNRL